MKAGKKRLDHQFTFTYWYIDYVLSRNNTKFSEYLKFIYPRELEIKETSGTMTSSSYLDLYLYIDNGKLSYHRKFSVSEQQFSFFTSMRFTVNPLC